MASEIFELRDTETSKYRTTGYYVNQKSIRINAYKTTMAWADQRLRTLNLAEFESHPCGLCEDDVDANFTTKAVLNIHKLEVHQDSKKNLVFQCDVCGIEFRKNECVHHDEDVRIHDPYTAVIGDKTCYFPTFSDLCECHYLRCKRVKAQVEGGGYFKGEEYGEYDPYVSCILCWLKFPCFTDDVQDHYRKRHQLENFQNLFACRYCHKTVAPQQSPFGPLSEVSKEYILEVKAFAKAHKICEQLVPQALNTNWQCKKCGQEFNNALSFFRHQITHSGKKVIQCQRCPERFLHPALYETHFKTHMLPKIFYCGRCPEYFDSDLPLKTHLREHAHLMHFKCQICGLTVKDFNSHLRNHLWESTNLPVPANLHSIDEEIQSKTESHLKFQCFRCEEYFFKASALGLHYRESHEMIENLQFRCPYCFQEFRRSDTAANNSADKTTYPVVINGRAEIEFTTFSKWCDHHVTNCDSTMNASETIFKCCKCIKLCVSERQLYIHTENHYKHLPKGCPACSYTTTSIQEMEEHLRKHNMIRVFKDHYYCCICFGFFQSKESSIGSGSFLREEKDAFLKFVESHALCDPESKRPNPVCSCNICQESFDHPEQLFQHEIRKHTNRYAVFCFQCGAGCLSSHELQQHTEHLGGEFSCNECFIEFSSAQDLEKHVVLLAKNGLYFCEVCDEVFSSLEDIANHCKNSHGEEEKLLCHHCNEMLENKYFLSHHILHLHRKIHESRVEGHRKLALELGLISAWELHKQGENVKKRKRKFMQKKESQEIIQNLATNGSENLNTVFKVAALDYIKQEDDDETESPGVVKKMKEETQPSAVHGTGDEIHKEPALELGLITTKELWKKAKKARLKKKKLMRKQANKESIQNLATNDSENQNNLLTLIAPDYIKEEENDEAGCSGPAKKRRGEDLPSSVHRTGDEIHKESALKLGLIYSSERKRAKRVRQRKRKLMQKKANKELIQNLATNGGENQNNLLTLIAPECIKQEANDETECQGQGPAKKRKAEDLPSAGKEDLLIPSNCDICEQVFQNSIVLDLHIREIHASEADLEFFCVFCHLKYQQADYIVQAATETQKFKYPIFSNGLEEIHFYNFSDFIDHHAQVCRSMAETGKGGASTSITGKPVIVESRNKKQNLIKSCASDQLKLNMPRKCPVCLFETDDAKEMRNHLKHHELGCAHQEYYFCKRCFACYLPQRPDLGTGRLVPEEWTNFLSFVTAHESCRKGDRKETNILPCKFCQPTNHIRNPRDLFEHEIRNHTKAFPLVCEECKEGFLWLHELTKHNKEEHQQYLTSKKARDRDSTFRRSSQFNGKPKGKTTTELTALQCQRVLSHSKVHNGPKGPVLKTPNVNVRPYKCDSCTKRFKALQHLQQHCMAVHQDESQ